MRFRTRNNNHMIDFLFPIVLFFVFALSALTVLLLAAGIYQSTTENSSLNYTSSTALSYISEKIHQNNISGSISIDEFDGCEALLLKQEVHGTSYCTYIYSYDNELKELFMREGADSTASSGKTIIEIKDFSIEKPSDNLVCFNCTDLDDHTASAIVSVR